MKEPKKIRLNPEAPTTKEPTKYRLLPIDKTEWDITGQNNDDIYVSPNLDNKLLDKINEDNSKNN